MQGIHPRIAEVIGVLEDAQQAMVSQLARLSEAQKNAPAAEGRWSVAQHLEHLAIVEDGCGRLMSKLIKEVKAAGTQETETSSLLHSLDRYEVWNVTRRVEAPEGVRPNGGLSTDDAFARLSTARARMIDALTSASGLALASVTYPHPLIGPLNVYQWGIVSAHHQRRHGTHIDAITDAHA